MSIRPRGEKWQCPIGDLLSLPPALSFPGGSGQVDCNVNFVLEVHWQAFGDVVHDVVCCRTAAGLDFSGEWLFDELRDWVDDDVDAWSESAVLQFDAAGDFFGMVAQVRTLRRER